MLRKFHRNSKCPTFTLSAQRLVRCLLDIAAETRRPLRKPRLAPQQLQAAPERTVAVSREPEPGECAEAAPSMAATESAPSDQPPPVRLQSLSAARKAFDLRLVDPPQLCPLPLLGAADAQNDSTAEMQAPRTAADIEREQEAILMKKYGGMAKKKLLPKVPSTPPPPPRFRGAPLESNGVPRLSWEMSVLLWSTRLPCALAHPSL